VAEDGHVGEYEEGEGLPADSWDAMTTNRPYKAMLSVDRFVREDIDFHETLFDEMNVPAVLRDKINSGNILSLFGVG